MMYYLPTALPLLLKIDADPVLSAQVNWVTGATAVCKDGCQNIMSDHVLCSEVIAHSRLGRWKALDFCSTVR